jgi:hypothetical protein
MFIVEIPAWPVANKELMCRYVLNPLRHDLFGHGWGKEALNFTSRLVESIYLLQFNAILWNSMCCGRTN